MQLICRFGCPNIIISDQGREFVNQLSERLFARTQTQHRVTSAYHPQTNGLTERFSQTLSHSLVARIDEDQTNWDELLDPILFSYRVTRQSSTKFSPFYMMFCRHPRLPIDVELSPQEELDLELSEENVEDTMEALFEIQKEIISKATYNISQAQKKQKEYYDCKQPKKRGKGESSSISGSAHMLSTVMLVKVFMNSKR